MKTSTYHNLAKKVDEALLVQGNIVCCQVGGSVVIARIKTFSEDMIEMFTLASPGARGKKIVLSVGELQASRPLMVAQPTVEERKASKPAEQGGWYQTETGMVVMIPTNGRQWHGLANEGSISSALMLPVLPRLRLRWAPPSTRNEIRLLDT